MKIIFLRSQLELDNVVHDNNMYVYLYATTNEQLMMAVVNIKQLFFFLSHCSFSGCTGNSNNIDSQSAEFHV